MSISPISWTSLSSSPRCFGLISRTPSAITTFSVFTINRFWRPIHRRKFCREDRLYSLERKIKIGHTFSDFAVNLLTLLLQVHLGKQYPNSLHISSVKITCISLSRILSTASNIFLWKVSAWSSLSHVLNASSVSRRSRRSSFSRIYNTYSSDPHNDSRQRSSESQETKAGLEAVSPRHGRLIIR